jgi:hypothetical protein
VRLRDVRLLAPQDPAAPDALDAHPLVREWFGQRLERTNPDAWHAAHGRLYEHLRDTIQEGETPTLEDLAPLYQAIPHGCRAGRHQEALKEIYMERICRRRGDGELVFYAINTLGAFSSDLAAISWFFQKPYEAPVTTLTAADQAWVLGVAAFTLRGEGRLAEALPAQRAALRIANETAAWGNAATRASTLSEAELLIGEVAAAVATASQSVTYADRSGDEFHIMGNRTTLADALHAAGRREEAERLFTDAEQRQKKQQPKYPLLYSLQGYRYCDLLLAKGERAATRDRASQTLEWARSQNWLLDTALDTLSLGGAHLGLALEIVASQRPAATARHDTRAAQGPLGAAVDGLRAAGTSHNVPSASSPAPPFAAASATGMAPYAISTRSRRSPSRVRCGFIFATWRSNARGSLSRASRRLRRSTGSSTTVHRSLSRPAPMRALSSRRRRGRT